MSRVYLVRSPEERFWSHVEKGEGCWEYRSSKSHRYGRIYVPGKGNYSAHRLSWEIHNGPIPPGLFVCHHCDNTRCVRPDHLFVGTHTDNMRDAFRKGRKKAPSSYYVRPLRAACHRGHEFTPENTYVRKNGERAGERSCRACRAFHHIKKAVAYVRTQAAQMVRSAHCGGGTKQWT